jgi:hypothetical protein
MKMLRKAAVLVLLGLVLAAPWASAAEAREREPLLHGLWSFLGSVWSAAGCRLDPLGGCSTGEEPQAPGTDAGCRLDPWGCPPLPSEDHGCRIDPWGCPEGQ